MSRDLEKRKQLGPFLDKLLKNPKILELLEK